MALHCYYDVKVVYAVISDSFHPHQVEYSTSPKVSHCSEQRAIGLQSAASTARRQGLCFSMDMLATMKGFSMHDYKPQGESEHFL